MNIFKSIRPKNFDLRVALFFKKLNLAVSTAIMSLSKDVILALLIFDATIDKMPVPQPTSNILLNTYPLLIKFKYIFTHDLVVE